MRTIRNLVGEKFERLLVNQYSRKTKGGHSWVCLCDCGKTVVILHGNLVYNRTLSCGCLRNERTRAASTTHGLSRSKEHNAWKKMRSRCLNPNDNGFKFWGGRGIKICSRWAHDFSAFFEDMGICPNSGYSIDRIDNNGDYSPENCRWASPKEQARNTRKNIILEIDGESLCLAAWSEKTGIPYHTLYGRVQRGWPKDRVISHGIP